MHVKKLLHNILSDAIHLKRLETLQAAVAAAINMKQVSLTKLGRNLLLPIQERSAIRRVDRFLGNVKLHEERGLIHKAVNETLIASCHQIKILVDWSSIPNTTYHVLRAALIAEGRALTVYEEVHPEKKLGNATVQRKFLKKLKDILPENCLALIVTDAGFHNDWFKDTLKMGWDYLGRVRGAKCYRKEGNENWEHCKKLLTRGKEEPEFIGQVELCRSNPLKTKLYRIKKKIKGRKSYNKKGDVSRNKASIDYSKSGREAWVLATSLSHHKFTSAKWVVKIYEKRMQIEEAFRDLKSPQYGFGFSEARSKNIKRIEILSLIAMLASFMAWLTGWVAEKKGLHYQFQANSIKSHRVLSLFFLGCRVIKRKIKIDFGEIKNLFFQLRKNELFAIEC